ncbi:hypothetical protein J8F10_03510 [Gemmata sp. G18]|uniref:Uncharacterized protein n=1 Tax=Gemmata palustris TaxID=2822762 RepID=A0ABS5BKY3_9BACT|nr:hypothetical protein [Gemmata palustris]MBP3954364.1 hypothetical protein [Gemmata palustris]
MIPTVTVLATGYAKGYSPNQCVHSTAREVFYWDEERAINRLVSEHPLCASIIALARAKILQALLDIGYRGTKSEMIAERNRAWAWLFAEQSDFREFCSDAGYSPRIVRAKAIEISQHGLQWRAAAGTGKRYRNKVSEAA